MNDEWPQVGEIIVAIVDAEHRLAVAHSRRYDIIVAMVRAGLTRRQIGALWGVSNVAITHVINKRGGTDAMWGEEAGPSGT